MRLHVLASGSSGNGYVLYNGKEVLVIECGVPYTQCLQAIGFHRERIVGAVTSHGHGDHCKYVQQYLEAGIKVYASQGAIGEMQSFIKKKVVPPVPVESQTLFEVGGFKILPFDTQHDCAEPFGYLIYHKEMGQVVFATDTYYLRYKFKNLTHIMIECNYAEDIIERNVAEKVIPAMVRDRVFNSHMSLETCIATLQANDLSKVNTIVLLHLSGNNSEPERFKDAVEEATGKLVFVAKKGLDIPFNEKLI